MTKCALVCGAGGFNGGHLARRLKRDGWWVRGVDLKFHEFSETEADDFVVGDLRDHGFCRAIVDRRFDEVYQLAADMGRRGLHLYRRSRRRFDAQLRDDQSEYARHLPQTWHQKTVLFVFGLHVPCL